MTQRAIIIGGGFFGLYLADYLARRKHEVLLLEKDPAFMTRASFNNQARVHNGYHYPRSILTALRSRVSFPRFCRDFSPAIVDTFRKYYLIGRLLGKVTAGQYRQFCSRIGAPCQPVRDSFTDLVNTQLIEDVFLTEEVAFDALELKKLVVEQAQDSGAKLLLGARAERVRQVGSRIELTFTREGEVFRECADRVFNCTYSMLNYLFRDGDIEMIPLKHEMTEMCLVDVPDCLKNIGLTVMCGPFFSVMPFPARGCHSFSHVRYTPHYDWNDREHTSYVNAHDHMASVDVASDWTKMKYDARRYIPVLAECRYRSSLFEVKTVLPRSEEDDSRPILFRPHHGGIHGFHCILGGKIDNVYDVVDRIEQLGILGPQPRSPGSRTETRR